MPTCRSSQKEFTRGISLRYGWSTDLCHAAFLEPMVREDDANWAYPQTVHPVRAVAVDLEANFDQEPQSWRGEMCAWHWGNMDLDPHGFAEPYFCSQPSYERDHNQLTTMLVFVGLDDSVGAVAAIEPGEPIPVPIPLPDPYQTVPSVDDGFALMAGMYHAPYWTEAQFHSGIQYCGQPK